MELTICAGPERRRRRGGGGGVTNLTHKFTCLSLGCASSDLNAPLVVCLEGNDSRFLLALLPPAPVLDTDASFALLRRSYSCFGCFNVKLSEL